MSMLQFCLYTMQSWRWHVEITGAERCVIWLTAGAITTSREQQKFIVSDHVGLEFAIISIFILYYTLYYVKNVKV